MKPLVRLITVPGVLILVAACQDAILPGGNPPPDLAEVHTEAESTCCDEVIVVVPGPEPGCDVWWKPECGGCAESLIGSPEDVQANSGCGGDGGGGGGGTPSEPCPDFGCDDPPAAEDFVSEEIPDCTKPVLAPWEHAYCNSAPPDGERLTRTESALERVRARGGECANIASFGSSLLHFGGVRYFTHVESIHGDPGGWGGPEIGALLASMWVDDFGGTPLGYPNFDLKLVHEIEHVMGRSHVPGTSETPNSALCAGL